jgi:RNA polymerase sigma-70 factor, ECF subfamily
LGTTGQWSPRIARSGMSEDAEWTGGWRQSPDCDEPYGSWVWRLERFSMGAERGLDNSRVGYLFKNQHPSRPQSGAGTRETTLMMPARDAREAAPARSSPPSLRLIGGRNGRGMSTIDMSIVQRAKRGDRAAFAALVDFYYARATRFAVHMLGNAQDAEEAVQDTFVRVHGALHRYDEFDRFESWLFRILANRCRTMMGREARRSRVLVYGDLPHDRGTPPDVDAIVWREEIQTALAALPAAQREAFLLRHVEGLEYEEMGRITGAGVSALKMRVKRACEFLRLRLAEVERA